MLDEGFGLLVALVDVIGEVAHLEGTCVLLGHGRDLLLHVVELVHVFTDLLVLLMHVLLDLNR